MYNKIGRSFYSCRFLGRSTKETAESLFERDLEVNYHKRSN